MCKILLVYYLPATLFMLCAMLFKHYFEISSQHFDNVMFQPLHRYRFYLVYIFLTGLGISLVRNGSVLYKGYGHALLDPPVAFDEFTVSNIGSTGKAFTTALLGVLITESQQKGGR